MKAQVILMISISCTLVLKVFGTALNWEPSMEPEIHRFQLDEQEDQIMDLILSSSPMVRISEMEYKRQLYSSQTLIEHSAVSIFGHNILLQQSRFDESTQLEHFESFVSRLDLNYEVMVIPHLTWSQCYTKCESHHSSIISNMGQLRTMEKITSRFKGHSWIQTQQSTKVKDMYDIEYTVNFGNMSILPYNQFNTSVIVLKTNSFGKMVQIDSSKIGSRAVYYDPSGKGEYYPFESYHLETRITHDRKFDLLLPLFKGSNHPREAYSRCVCIRDLAKNRKAQLEANLIVNNTFNDVARSPTTIELYRLKRAAPQELSNVETIIGLKMPYIYQGHRFLYSRDLHPLKIKADPLYNQSLLEETQVTGLYMPGSSKRDELRRLDPAYQNGILNGISHDIVNKTIRVRRAAPLLISLIGSSLLKAGLASAPYLYSELGSPLQSLYKEAKEAIQVSTIINPSFQNMSSYQDYLDDKYAKAPISIRKESDRFQILTTSHLPDLTSVKSPDKELAMTVQQAAKALLYFKTVIMQNLPQHIIHSLSYSMPYPINQDQPGLCNIHHSSTFLLYSCMVEIIRKDLAETSVSITAMPHKMVSNQIYQYDLEGHNKIQISDLSVLQNNENTRDCIMALLSSSPQRYDQYCSEAKSKDLIVSKIHQLKKGSLYQILGTSTVTVTCIGKISESVLLEKMINLVYISNACELSVTHGNLRQDFPRISTQNPNIEYQVLLSYDIYNYIDFQAKTKVWLFLISTILISIVIILAGVGIFFLYVKKTYDPQLVEETEHGGNIEMSVFEPRESQMNDTQGMSSDQQAENQYQRFKRYTQNLRPIPQPSKVYDEINDQTIRQAMSIATEIVQ